MKKKRVVNLLDVITRAGIIGESEDPGKAIKAIADGDVDGLSEDPIPPLAIGDDLGVPPADVEDDGVLGAGDDAAHLDVGDAVVDGDDGLVPEQGEDADGDGGDLEGGAHAGALGVAEAVDVGGGEGGVGEGGADEGEEVAEVVVGGLAGEEAVAGRGDVGVARVREDRPV